MAPCWYLSSCNCTSGSEGRLGYEKHREERFSACAMCLPWKVGNVVDNQGKSAMAGHEGKVPGVGRDNSGGLVRGNT